VVPQKKKRIHDFKPREAIIEEINSEDTKAVISQTDHSCLVSAFCNAAVVGREAMRTLPSPSWLREEILGYFLNNNPTAGNNYSDICLFLRFFATENKITSWRFTHA
jgi:hypothetical protein